MVRSTRLVILIKNISTLYRVENASFTCSLWGRKRFLLPVTTQLVILIKNIYILYGVKRFLLHVTYFPTNGNASSAANF